MQDTNASNGQTRPLQGAGRRGRAKLWAERDRCQGETPQDGVRATELGDWGTGDGGGERLRFSRQRSFAVACCSRCIISIGSGKMIVEFFSAAISVSVCR